MCAKKNIPVDEAIEYIKKINKQLKKMSGNEESRLMCVFERRWFKHAKVKEIDDVIIRTIPRFSHDGWAHNINYRAWKKVYKDIEIKDANPNKKENLKKYFKYLDLKPWEHMFVKVNQSQLYDKGLLKNIKNFRFE